MERPLSLDDRIRVFAEGRTYSVARFCPHAGNDLADTGELLPGRILRCLAHRYEFSLDSGRCLNGTGMDLDVELIGMGLDTEPSHRRIVGPEDQQGTL